MIVVSQRAKACVCRLLAKRCLNGARVHQPNRDLRAIYWLGPVEVEEALASRVDQHSGVRYSQVNVPLLGCQGEFFQGEYFSLLGERERFFPGRYLSSPRGECQQGGFW